MLQIFKKRCGGRESRWFRFINSHPWLVRRPLHPRIWRPRCSKRAALHRSRAFAQHRLAPQLLPIPTSLPFTPYAPLTSDFSSKKGEWLQQVKGTQKKADLDNLVTSLREELGQLRVAKVCV